jgi:hypothetical protein
LLIVPFEFRNPIFGAGLSYLGWSLDQLIFNFQGECEMKITMPSTISGWCMWLFFLLTGLAAVLPSVFGMSFMPMLIGLLALAYAILSFLGM